MTLGELDLEEAAVEAAGNWKDFDGFLWFREQELESPDDWAIIYTCHRDSGLLDQSNAEQISQALLSYMQGEDPDVVDESDDHWAVGHVNGFSVRVYRNGQITDAFRTYHELATRIADYPILDDEDCSAREYEATLDNISNGNYRVKDHYELPDAWANDVYTWLARNEASELDNRDGRGGFPSEEALDRACAALGYEQIED